jgi:hypothetical protein
MGTSSRARLGRRSVYNIKMDFREMGCEYGKWIEVRTKA